MTDAVESLLMNFKERFGVYPKAVQFDEGKEFYNVGVKNLLKEHDVHYFSTKSDRKAAIVERFNRMLKTSMWKYFYNEKTHDWIDVLDDLTHNYNHAKHSSTLVKPADVNTRNKDQVWITLYGYGLGEFPLPKFKIDDVVRISKYKNIFQKGYEANFTEEKFKIIKVFRGDPNMYEIEDENGEPIIGKFYEDEMSPIKEDPHVYKIEKILKKKRNGVGKMVRIR